MAFATKEKEIAYKKEYYLKNKTRIRAKQNAYRKEYYKTRKAYTRSYELRKNYGITDEQYSSMLSTQSGLCAICNCTMKPGNGTHIDHCHRTGRVRSLLCSGCNTGIGLLKEDPVILASAIKYLEVHSG